MTSYVLTTENYKNVTLDYFEYETELSLARKHTGLLMSHGVMLIPCQIISTKNSLAGDKRRRYECMQRFPDLFIVFYSWKEFGRALSVSRNMLIVRKTLSLRDFSLIKSPNNISSLLFQISVHGTRKLYGK